MLQPAAIDLLNPPAAARLKREGYLLAVQAGGNPAVIERYARELAGAEAVEGREEEDFWRGVREFTPAFLADFPAGAVVRVSAKISQLAAVMEALEVPALARAGSGVVYAYFGEWQAAGALRGWKAVIEFAPPEHKGELDLWPAPGSDFEIMERVKRMFDPQHLLNRGRLYGRI